MPGRDYPKAYALLEQSLNGVDPLPSPQKSPEPAEDRSWLASPSPNVGDSRGISELALGIKPHEIGFPPTPPTVTRSEKPDNGNNIPNGDTSNATPTLGTPPNGNSLPTPDVTPPRDTKKFAQQQHSKSSGTFLSPSLNASYSSPDSFITARDDHSTNGGVEDQLPEEHDRSLNRSPGWLHATNVDIVNNIKANEPVGIWSEEADGEIDAPTHTLRHKPSLDDIDVAIEDERRQSYDVEDDWDSEKMKHVTLRRKDPKSKSVAVNGASVEGNNDSIPILMRGLSMKNHVSNKEPNVEVRTPSPVEQAPGAWPATPQLGASPRGPGSDRKRHSGTSGSSTIVEAIVIDSPPVRKRKLRHASKNLALRDDASNSGASRPNTANSEDPPLYQLLKTEYQPSDPIHRDSTGSEASAGLAIRPLRRKKERLSLGSDGIAEDGHRSPVNSAHSKLQPFFAFESYDRRSFSEPVRSKAPLAAAAEQASASFVPAYRTRLSPSKLRHSSDFGFTSLDQESHPVMNGVGVNGFSHADGREIDLEHTNASMDYSVDASESLPRVSIEQPRDDPSPNPSQAMRSLQSFKSEASDVQVNEATAVNLYPTNTGSVVVVKHASSPTEGTLKQELDFAPSLNLANGQRAYISLEPSTPTRVDSQASVDSPLRNPRNAPEPPVVAVIPPTPAKELEEQEDAFDKQRVSSAPPQRRSSLMRRAFQPLATLAAGNVTGFNRRSVSNQYPQGAQPGSTIRTPAVSEPTQLDGNLHPFWQPRRFWNDFSDTEDEDSDFEDEDDELPAGGDTSEVVDNKNSIPTWRRGGSLRGFLIGNSLGIQRGPTNRRRHVVSLPRHVSVRDSARRSGTVKGRKKPGYFKALRQRMRAWSVDREEEKRRNQREKLRRSIGNRFYVEPDITPNKTS